MPLAGSVRDPCTVLRQQRVGCDGALLAPTGPLVDFDVSLILECARVPPRLSKDGAAKKEET